MRERKAQGVQPTHSCGAAQQEPHLRPLFPNRQLTRNQHHRCQPSQFRYQNQFQSVATVSELMSKDHHRVLTDHQGCCRVHHLVFDQGLDQGRRVS